MPADDHEVEDAHEVLAMLDVPTDAPKERRALALALAGLAGVILSVPVLGARAAWSVPVGSALLLLGGVLLVVGGIALVRRQQLHDLVVRSLRGGLTVPETARTIGGVPPLRGLRFEGWMHHAERRVQQAPTSLLRGAAGRSGPAVGDGDMPTDEWAQRARHADRLVAALVDLLDVTRPGPLRDRLEGVVGEARAVRADVHRLTVVGAAAGDTAAAGAAASRVDQLLRSLRVAVDSTTGSLVAAEGSDGIDTAAALQDTATALLRAHEEIAADSTGPMRRATPESEPRSSSS